MSIIDCAFGYASASDLRRMPDSRKMTPMRWLAERACMHALTDARQDINPEWGIVGCLTVGEKFPELWSQYRQEGRKLRPRQFGSSVLNAPIGHCAVELRLTGPQIVVSEGSGITTESNGIRVAMSQIRHWRAPGMFMLVFAENDFTVSACLFSKVDS